MILTPQELIELTQWERPSAQLRELEHLGIPARPRRDGTLVVLWDDVRASNHEAAPKRREPQLRLA